MKNVVIGRFEAEDIRKQVEKVLRDLDNPEPPLRLDDVREVLRLDRQYYSSQDDGSLREFVHRLRISGRQILDRPTRLWDVIRKARLSALWVPDRRRILIDSELPVLKHRWAEGHEVGHSLAPWHGEFLYGDSEEELNPACQEKLESEANHAAGQLLFMGERFAEEANDSQAALSVVLGLADRFGNTKTSTLWRFVEETHSELPMVGVVSLGKTAEAQAIVNGRPYVRYCVESPAFKKRFAHTTESELLLAVRSYCSRRRAGPLGRAEIVLQDANGCQHVFQFESFSNSYDVLTLGVYVRPVASMRASNR
jgi:hypothetical protein